MTTINSTLDYTISRFFNVIELYLSRPIDKEFLSSIVELQNNNLTLLLDTEILPINNWPIGGRCFLSSINNSLHSIIPLNNTFINGSTDTLTLQGPFINWLLYRKSINEFILIENNTNQKQNLLVEQIIDEPTTFTGYSIRYDPNFGELTPDIISFSNGDFQVTTIAYLEPTGQIEMAFHAPTDVVGWTSVIINGIPFNQVDGFPGYDLINNDALWGLPPGQPNPFNGELNNTISVEWII